MLSQRNQVIKIFAFIYSNPFLLSYNYNRNSWSLKYNYCLNREKFRWLLIHVQMITGVGLLVVIHPFREAKLAGYLHIVLSMVTYS